LTFRAFMSWQEFFAGAQNFWSVITPVVIRAVISMGIAADYKFMMGFVEYAPRASCRPGLDRVAGNWPR
jgi:hypothetical protein